MAYSPPNTSSLQSLMFDTEDFCSSFFLHPLDRELEFHTFYTTLQQLLSPSERACAESASGEGSPCYTGFSQENGSTKEKAHLERKVQAEQERLEYPSEDPQLSLSRLEMLCPLTAKQSSKGKKRWFIGYKAHAAADDFGVSVAYAVTGACVHDCKVAVPLMKMTVQRTDFLYALMDKGYLNPGINAYADMTGARRSSTSGSAGVYPHHRWRNPKRQDTRREPPLREPTANSRTGTFPPKSIRRGADERYDIELAILLARKEARVGKSPETSYSVEQARSWLQGMLGHARNPCCQA
jgi:hypothetical protein